MYIDWLELEAFLYKWSVAMLREFAAMHPDEVIYGFMFDCNADEGKLLLCMNTLESLQESIDDSPDEDPEEREAAVRWNPGDWLYQGLRHSDVRSAFDLAWETYEDRIRDHSNQQWGSREPYSCATLFLESVCRVAIRLEQDDVFTLFRRTDDFAVFVLDQAEPQEDGWARLDEVRGKPFDPDTCERARALDEEYRLACEVYEAVVDERKVRLPYSETKLMLRDSLVAPPSRVSEDRWLVYENAERGFQIEYSPPVKAYRVSIRGGEPQIVTDILELPKLLEGIGHDSGKS